MGKYYRLIGDYDAETTAYSACAGAAQTSPYTPDEDARLTGIRVVVSRSAASTLTDGVQIRLTCTTFKPNTMHVACVGTGLQTAPAFAAPIIDFDVDQPVKAGVPITVEGRNILANAVTNEILILGRFES
jgi:hypothetical protein